MPNDEGAKHRTVVRCANVSRTFNDGRQEIVALNDFSFSFPGASLVAVTGPSGSGKSTLLSLIGAIDFADEGTIEVAGTELGTLSTVEQAEFRAAHVSYLYPEHNLLPMFTVYENIGLALSVKRLPEPEIDARIRSSLDFLAINELAYRRPGDLSSGERARAALARAVASENEVLIADEPTAHLDRENARMVADLLASVAATPDRTVIVATHDPLVAEAATVRVHLRDGRIVP